MTSSGRRPNIIQRYLLSRDVYYGWFVVAGCFFVLLSVFGMITAFSVFFTHVVAVFETSHADTSIVFSLQMISTYGSLSVLGFAVDRFAVSRLATIGAVLVGGGLIGTGIVPSFLGLVVAYSLVAGIGFGLTLIISYTTPVKWFDRRRGLASGIAVSGSGVGMLLMPPLSEWLINGYGWQTAYFLVGVGAFLVLVLAGRVVVDSPQTLDLDPCDEFPDGGVPAASTTSSIGEQARSMKRIVGSVPFFLVTLSFMTAYTPHYALSVHYVEYARVSEIGRNVGVLALSVLGISNVVGKFVAGYAADAFKPTTVLAGSAALCGLSVIVIALVRQPAIVLSLTVFYGVGIGGVGAVLSLVVADFFGTLNLNTAFGVSAVAYMVPGAVAPFAVGYVFDRFGVYTPALVISGFVGISTVSLIYAARLVRTTTDEHTTAGTSTE